jgi:HNH endonuclease
MGIPDDAEIAAGVRQWVELMARGTREDREELMELIEEGGVSGFPSKLGTVALSELDARTLWKTFDDDELQDLYDLCHEVGLSSTAELFYAAALVRPYIDSGKVPPEVEELVLKRDGRRCLECGETDDLTIDHKIVPWSEGGSSTDPDNLQVLCRSCNSRKGTRPWSTLAE